jgi:CSLREA domain-containing protein
MPHQELTTGTTKNNPRRTIGTALAVLVCALIALAALPALAAAASSAVDSTADEPDATLGTGACATAAGKCTLRAAIETANSDAAADTIAFDETPFDGEASHAEIQLTEPLPPLTAPVAIGGGRACAHQTGPSSLRFGPCAGLVASTGPAALVVESPDVRIEGLAIGGDAAGILAEQSPDLIAVNDWLGFRLNSQPSGGLETGLFLGPGSDEARVGHEDISLGGPDVFGNSEVGIYVDGASDAEIRSDKIGVAFDGVTKAPVEVGIRIVDSAGSEPDRAEDDEVGGVLTPNQVAAAACVGPCNVIAATVTGIDLTGHAAEEVEPAAGPTTIVGNYLGLGQDGLTPAVEPEEPEVGIYAGPEEGGGPAGGPGSVTIGGTTAGERNIIDGGRVGVFEEGAEGFRLIGNAFAWTGTQSIGESPNEAAVDVFARSLAEKPVVGKNAMKLSGVPVGIETHGHGALIVDNAIEGSRIGVLTAGADGGEGDLIKENAVFQAAAAAIKLTNDGNDVIGSFINQAPGYGIEVEKASGNRIGGEFPAAENVVNGSGLGAVAILGGAADRDEVLANHGGGSNGGFIRLIALGGSALPNDGIQPPTLGTVQQSRASGTARPGATVRLFTEEDLGDGHTKLNPLLATITANSQGQWSENYGTQPVGTRVVATQTLNGGTSEVSTPVPAEVDRPEPPKGGGENPPVVTPPAPALAPKVTGRPGKITTSRTAKFRFVARTPGSTFECELDGRDWSYCTSPGAYKDLRPGKHTFRVRAVLAGVPGAVTKFQFRIKP